MLFQVLVLVVHSATILILAIFAYGCVAASFSLLKDRTTYSNIGRRWRALLIYILAVLFVALIIVDLGSILKNPG